MTQAINCKYLWDSKGIDNRKRIQVVEHPQCFHDVEDSDEPQSSAGACNDWIQEADTLPLEIAADLARHALLMIVEDELDPKTVHQEMLKIDEYRELMECNDSDDNVKRHFRWLNNG